MTDKTKAHAGRGDAAALFAALGDDTRLAIVSRLSEEAPLSINRLTSGTGLTRQAVTKHLRMMEGTGLVRGASVGREVVWRLEPRRLKEARHYLERISRQWDDALGRLVAYVED